MDIKWSDYFYYDESSPTCLFWNVEIRSGINSKIRNTYKGMIAGNIKNNKKASQVQLNGVNYFCHRIIWEMFNGSIEENFVIDHIDGNCLNNKVNNLRKVTQEVNMRNCKKSVSNTSETTGVYYRKTRGLYEYWCAFWREDGKVKVKCFSFKEFGDAEAKQKAENFRKTILEQFGNYTERHGK